MEKENTHSSLQKNVGCSSQTEPRRRKETDKKIDTKQQFTLTHTLPSNFYVSTVFYCRNYNTRNKNKNANKGTARNRNIHVLMQAKPIIYRMLRHCPPKSFIIVVNAQFHYI